MLNLMQQVQNDSAGADGRDERAELELLAQKASCGSRDALYKLCKKIARIILFHAMQITGNRADAEDIAQETLIRVCENIKDLRDPKTFRAWLGKIVTNEAYRYMKKNSKRGTVLNIDDYLESVTEESDDLLPQKYVENSELRAAVMEIVAKLPMRQREAVMLHYYNGLNVKQTGEAMNINKQAASSYLALAREKIKRDLERRQLTDGGTTVLAILPASVILKNALNREGAEFALHDSDWVDKAVENCRKHTPISPGRASSEPKGSGGILIGIFAAVISVALLTWAVYNWSIPLNYFGSGGVVFSGGVDYGDGRVYVNPGHAVPEADETIGNVSTVSWWITRAGDEAILYNGDSGTVDEALQSLNQDGEDGEYLINFRLTDDRGNLYRVKSNFYILKG